MKNMVISLFFALSFLLSFFSFSVLSCGVSQNDYDLLKIENNHLKTEVAELSNENDYLKQELDQFKYGKERMIALIEKSYSENNIEEAKEYIETLKRYHPDSVTNTDFIRVVSLIEKREEEEMLRIFREESERAMYEEITLFDLELWGRKSGAIQETKNFKSKVEFSHQDGVRMVFRDPDKITNGLFFIEKRFPEMTEWQSVTIYFHAKRQGGLLLNSVIDIIAPQ
jgi:cell division protein FtsB